jgi:hypothetical protein
LLIFGEFAKEILKIIKKYCRIPILLMRLGPPPPVHKEIAVVGKETGFQDVGESDVEVLGPSLPLTAEESTDLEKQAHGKAGGDDDIKILSVEEKVC